MKILFFLDHIGGGGRERRMAQLVLALDRMPNVQMVAVTATPNIDYTEVHNTKMKIHIINSPSRWSRIKQYDAIIKEFMPNLIHLWTETALFCTVLPLLAKKNRCKFVVGFVADGRPMAAYPFMQRQCINFAFHMADAVVSNSKAGLVAKKVPEGKSFVIYNGFDKKRLVDVDVKEKKNELGIKAKYLVTMCARVDAVKDWKMFIALAEKSKEDDAFFLAVGGGTQLDYYQKLVKNKKLNNILFVGRRSDVMEIFAVTDVCVLFTNSSLHAEGVSNSIMESMAAGVPVVATDGGGTSEIIINGENGYIVEPRNVEQAYHKLYELLNDDNMRFEIGNKARNTIRNFFDVDKKGLEYMELYKSLLS